MKFGKQLVSQMVPEWQDAYMDYNYLKTLLKDIQDFNPRKKPPSSLTRVVSNSYVAFSGLLQRNMTTKRSPHGHGGTADIEDQVILIQNEGSQVGRYETKFQMLSEDGAEYELVFFRRLDDEFNKVDRFYKEKVEEVLKEAALLNKQMDALIAFRIRVKNPEASMDWSVEMTRLRSNVAAASAAMASASVPNSCSKSEGEPHDVIEEPEQSSEEESDESFEEMGSNDTKSFHHCNSIHEEIQRHNSKQSRPAPLQSNSIHEEIQRHNSKQSRPPLLQILEMVKINNTLESPISTIKGILKVDRNKDLEFRKENLGKVEEQLKNAFIQFYQKLRLLKNYSFLNLLAFSKIMKKYDKAASRRASGPYLNMVDSSYLGSSEDVNRLISRVEATFIKHFANSNRREGMSKLRLKPKKERHRTTFSLGLFTGFTLALLISLIMIYQFRNLLRKKGYDQYMQNMYPLYSIFAFIVLHVQMYAANIYFWRKYRVNYTFIFGFKQGTELGYREVSLISTGLATLALASVLANLDMELDERSKDYKAFTELLPLILLSLVVAITFCPFNIIYRSSRYFLLYCVFRCICAPLYKVTLPDFFMADQFTSQIQALRSLEFYICYYGWGDYKHRRNTCKSSDVYNTFYFVVATIPYCSRLLQCLRRLYEEKDPMQGYNALKYFSTVVAVLIRTAYNKQGGNAWWVLAWITSAIATIYSTYWDLIVDWGLLQRKSRNRWLRDKLILTHKSVYFIVMVLNVVLRLAWLQTVLNFQVSFLHKETLNTIVASLEIIRRGIWNFFRLENEHLNNVGKYRAFKSVPLPFNYDEDQDDKDS